MYFFTGQSAPYIPSMYFFNPMMASFQHSAVLSQNNFWALQGQEGQSQSQMAFLLENQQFLETPKDEGKTATICKDQQSIKQEDQEKSMISVSRVSNRPCKRLSRKIPSAKRKSNTKLVFDIEWKNENRNIVPNIMNQMLSFLEKRHKSEWLISKLFNKYPHSEQETVKKFYCYMKIAKDRMGNYINEGQLREVYEPQDPEHRIYSQQEQQFYRKICRIAIDYFFRTECVLISLTSKRMSKEKKVAHLIARRALTKRIDQLLCGH